MWPLAFTNIWPLCVTKKFSHQMICRRQRYIDANSRWRKHEWRASFACNLLSSFKGMLYISEIYQTTRMPTQYVGWQRGCVWGYKGWVGEVGAFRAWVSWFVCAMAYRLGGPSSRTTRSPLQASDAWYYCPLNESMSGTSQLLWKFVRFYWERCRMVKCVCVRSTCTPNSSIYIDIYNFCNCFF